MQLVHFVASLCLRAFEANLLKYIEVELHLSHEWLLLTRFRLLLRLAHRNGLEKQQLKKMRYASRSWQLRKRNIANFSMPKQQPISGQLRSKSFSSFTASPFILAACGSLIPEVKERLSKESDTRPSISRIDPGGGRPSLESNQIWKSFEFRFVGFGSNLLHRRYLVSGGKCLYFRYPSADFLAKLASISPT